MRGVPREPGELNLKRAPCPLFNIKQQFTSQDIDNLSGQRARVSHHFCFHEHCRISFALTESSLLSVPAVRTSNGALQTGAEPGKHTHVD